MTPELVQLVAREGGWTGADLVDAIWVILGESGGNISARGTNSNGSIDRGLWQINSRYHPQVTVAQADDPVFATRYARQLWSKHRWKPWHAADDKTSAKAIARRRRAAQLVKAAGYAVPAGGALAVAVLAALWYFHRRA